jgi:hypothetical protein
MVKIKVVIAPRAMRRHFNLRRCFLDERVLSSSTRTPSLHLSLPRATSINGIPSARQNANASSA